MKSAKDLLLYNIGTRYRADGSLVDPFLRIAMTTTIIENGLEGIVRSGLRLGSRDGGEIRTYCENMQ